MTPLLSEAKLILDAVPNLAPVAALAFLGAALLVALCLLVGLLCLTQHKIKVAFLAGGFAVALVAFYALLLCSVSLVSNDKNLPLGDWKYFCELDCHIAYSISRFEEFATIPSPTGEKTAALGHGSFVVVSLKTWFDESTISAHRGNAPLAPGPRTLILLDDSGRRFQRSTVAESALARAEGPTTPLGKPLRPGDSYITQLVFEVPENSHAQRLLVTDPENDWLDRFVIGHERSFLHKKVYLDLRPPAPVSAAAAPVVQP